MHQRMGGTLAGGALALCVSLSASCVLSTATFISPYERTEVVRATHEIEVRAVPGDAQVRVGDGEPVGTPGVVHVPYDVKRAGKRYRRWPVIVAMAASMGTMFYFFVRAIDDGDFTSTNTVIAYGAFADLMSGALFLPKLGALDSRWRERASVRPIAVTAEVEVAWDGWEPARAKVAVPAQAYLTVRRPTLGTFDEALFAWERAGREPTPAGLFRLGEAYDRRAQRTGQLAAAERALHYYDRYLASGHATPELAARARERVSALRGGAGVQR